MIKILVTGFGAFPGARHNPSLALLSALRRKRTRLARLGIMLELRTLPVVYASIGPTLEKLATETRPAAILHFGLASRRKIITLEMRARNRVNLLHPDAAGVRPCRATILAEGPEIAPARVPAKQIISAWRRAGLASALSHDAGDYLCNASFYHSLVTPHAACVGFIHIPYPCRGELQASLQRNRRPCFADIVIAAEIALTVIAKAARQNRFTTGEDMQAGNEPFTVRSHPHPCTITESASGLSP